MMHGAHTNQAELFWACAGVESHVHQQVRVSRTGVPQQFAKHTDGSKLRVKIRLWSHMTENMTESYPSYDRTKNNYNVYLPTEPTSLPLVESLFHIFMQMTTYHVCSFVSFRVKVGMIMSISPIVDNLRKTMTFLQLTHNFQMSSKQQNIHRSQISGYFWTVS